MTSCVPEWSSLLVTASVLVSNQLQQSQKDRRSVKMPLGENRAKANMIMIRKKTAKISDNYKNMPNKYKM